MSVAFSADGRLLASGASDGSIRLWNVATGTLVSERPGSRPGDSDDDPRAVTSVALSPDGSMLATGSEGEERTLRLWRLQGGEISELGAFSAGWVHSIAFSPDGGRLVSGNSIGEVRLWNARTREPIGAPLTAHQKNVYGVAFSPVSAKIASAGIDKKVILWDAALAEWPHQACAIAGKGFSSSVKWPRNVQSAFDGLLGEGKTPCSPT
jgi:WD40 repeat protein